MSKVPIITFFRPIRPQYLLIYPRAEAQMGKVTIVVYPVELEGNVGGVFTG